MRIRSLPILFALVSTMACTSEDPWYDWMRNDPFNIPDPALADLEFTLNISDVNGATDFFLGLAEGDSVDLYTIVLDVNSPATGSLVQIREMSGTKTGRVVFRGVADPTGNAHGTLSQDPITHRPTIRLTWQDVTYAFRIEITKVQQINRTFYLNSWAVRVPLAVDACAADTEAPVISMPMERTSLWSPDHRMERVASGIRATDNDDPAPVLSVSVLSSEPVTGRGDETSPDWDIVANEDGTFDVWLRAERLGTGAGRTYTIVGTASDACGNASATTKIVTVPKSQGRGK